MSSIVKKNIDGTILVDFIMPTDAFLLKNGFLITSESFLIDNEPFDLRFFNPKSRVDDSSSYLIVMCTLKYLGTESFELNGLISWWHKFGEKLVVGDMPSTASISPVLL
jgi:hypothetical protein